MPLCVQLKPRMEAIRFTGPVLLGNLKSKRFLFKVCNVFLLIFWVKTALLAVSEKKALKVAILSRSEPNGSSHSEVRSTLIFYAATMTHLIKNLSLVIIAPACLNTH